MKSGIINAATRITNIHPETTAAAVKNKQHLYLSSKAKSKKDQLSLTTSLCSSVQFVVYLFPNHRPDHQHVCRHRYCIKLQTYPSMCFISKIAKDINSTVNYGNSMLNNDNF